jgi:hypothetical protein
MAAATVGVAPTPPVLFQYTTSFFDLAVMPLDGQSDMEAADGGRLRVSPGSVC